MADAPIQASLFTADVVAQLAPPWWACLGGGLAVAGVAEAEHRRKRKRLPQIRQHGVTRPRDHEPAIVTLPPAEVQLPRTVGDCRGPGICPKFGCPFNVVLHVKTVDASTQTISVGGRGGNGHGASIATKRDRSGKVKMEDLDAVVDAAVELIDTLPSTCVLDYVEDPDLADLVVVDDDEPEPTNPDGPIGAHMTLAAIARVFGVTREGMRRTELRALLKARRAEAADELAPDYVPEVCR